jgi:hypothetical protein
MSPLRFSSLLLLFVAAPQVFGVLFNGLLPPGIIPAQCQTQLDQAGMCFMQQSCAEKCFPDTSLGSAAKINKALEFYYTPSDATDCAEFQDPICPLTKTCCSPCRSRINSLYRCIIRNTAGLSPEVQELQRTCPLNCVNSTDTATTNNNSTNRTADTGY